MIKQHKLDMSTMKMVFLVHLLLALSQVHADHHHKLDFVNYGIDTLNRSSFPLGFLFGAASAAFQIEGGWNADGKGPSIWDRFTHKLPEKIKDHQNGDVADNSFHLYNEDIRLLKEMNVDSYRFSISWSRVLPYGKQSGGVNEKGIQYYNNLINGLLAKGIKPMVTLFHFDLPQALEDEYGGLLSPKIVDDFHDFANLCFERFGDRVKHWITINEPASLSTVGYESGLIAPGRCSSWMNNNCTGGNSATEPYIVAHHQLLAHASAVKLYKTKYQVRQKGIIGITLAFLWLIPCSRSHDDQLASVRAREFYIGWFMDPIVFGDYPLSMKDLVGLRLPKLTKEQSEQVKGSFDFIGINYYTSSFVKDASFTNHKGKKSYTTDSKTLLTAECNGKLIGKPYGVWIHSYPRGIWKLLLYIKTKYHNPIIFITENGVDQVNNSTLQLSEKLNDTFRIKYYYAHLSFIHRAIIDGVRIKGFYGWSIMDNFEWILGFTTRFGLNYVDFSDGLKRYPKLSAKWFRRFLQRN